MDNNARIAKLVVAIATIPLLFAMFIVGEISGDSSMFGVACICAVLTAAAVFIVHKFGGEK